MKNKNLIPIIIIIAGVAYVFKFKKSPRGLLSGLGITPHSMLSAALPIMGIRNPILSTIISEGAKGVFSGNGRKNYDVIDADYKRVK